MHFDKRQLLSRYKLIVLESVNLIYENVKTTGQCLNLLYEKQPLFGLKIQWR